MLFALKRRPGPALALLAVFVLLAIASKAALDLDWRWAVAPEALGLGILALAASDGLVHGVLTLVLGQRYLLSYRALVDYFRPQGINAILSGGLLAGGEELLFRGVCLEALRTQAGFPAAVAVVLVALLFGALHTIPGRTLAPFGVWAVWEGTLLGTAYVMTNSLGTVVILHMLHDVFGFSLFAVQRRTGWLLG